MKFILAQTPTVLLCVIAAVMDYSGSDYAPGLIVLSFVTATLGFFYSID